MRQRKKVIAVLLPNLACGGVERVRLILAHEFSERGYSVEFVLMRATGELLPQAREDFPIFDLAASRLRQVPFSLARYLRHRRPDALLAAMWPLTSIAVLSRWLSGHHCRVVISEHNQLAAQYAPRGRLHMALLRVSTALCYRLADGVVGVSDGVVRGLAELASLDRGRFHVIHNPVLAPAPLSPEDVDFAERLWGCENAKRILSVGRLKAQKNHALLLQAFARVAKEREARLMILGVGPLEQDLRSLAASLGVAERVIFAGFQPDTAPFLRTADVFVLSSDYEGFGNVIVEALSCGTPVVSTDCPSGPAEILDKGRFGHLVPVGNADALARAISDALEITVAKESLLARASTFSPDASCRAYLDLLFPNDVEGVK